MQLHADLALVRARDHLEQYQRVQMARQLKALSRAKRAERKAERRLLQAWQTRLACEEAFGPPE